MPSANKPFGLMYGQSTNWGSVSINDGTLYMVIQPTVAGKDPYVMGYVDLGSTRYAIGAPAPDEVATAISLKYPLIQQFSGNKLATPLTVSYSGGNSGNVLVEDSTILTDSATGTSTANANIANGSIYVNRVVTSKTGSNAAQTTLVNSIKITGANDTSVTYNDTTKTISISTTVPTTLPNPQALIFTDGTNTLSYDGSVLRSGVTYSTVGAAAANTEITAASFGNDNKTLTLTKAAGNITVELPATAAINISGKATTAGTADQVAQALVFASDGTGAAAGSSFDGSTRRVISYNSIGAAPSTGIDVSAIDWTSGTIPIGAIPEAAIEKLYIAPAATSGQTNAQAAAAYLAAHDEITEGDVIQVGDGGELFFVYDDNGTLAVKTFSAGTAAQATKVSHALTFIDGQGAAGVAAGQTWDGSANKTIGYATVGAAGKDTEITAAAFGNDNKTLTLTKAAGNITVALPATAAINISGKATTAGTADQVAHALSFVVDGSTPVGYDGSQNRTITYTTNSAMTYQSQIGTLSVFGTNYPIYAGLFWQTFDS